MEPNRQRDRQRRYRARRRQGLPSLTDALVETGRLSGWDADNRAAVSRASGQLFLDFVAAVERTGRDPLVDPQRED